MRKISLLSFIACLLLVFSACRKDDIDINKQQTPLPPEVIIESAITGIVTDRNGQALENTMITLDGNTVTTDVNGYFLITGNAPKRSALLHIEKTGYFRTHHAVTPIKHDTSITVIQLIQRDLSGSFSSDQGGLITMNNGASVTFASNSFIDHQGNLYQGSVNVYAHPLDPTDPDMFAFMPGDLTAIDSDENYVGLKSYGMINVELEDDSGNPLQINKEATISVPVPLSLRNNPPATIPLWYFDDTDGLWKEEGSATLDNNVYIGEVSHFTFWNCDIPFPLANIEGNIRMGEYATSLKVRITRPDGSTRCTHTTSNGFFSGKVPQNELLTLAFIDACGNIMHTETIGPFSTDTDLGSYSVPLSNGYVFVFGTIEDCDQNPVSNGYARIEIIDEDIFYQFPTYPNGFFNGLIATCDATELEVYGVDLNNDTYGNTTTMSISSPMALGVLSACGNQIQEGLEIQYNGTSHFIPNCVVTTSDPTANVFTFQSTDNQANGNRANYTITVLDWQNDPSNPSWQYTYYYELFNTPDPVFGFTDGTVTMLQRAQAPGEYTMVNIDNATITNTITRDTFTGGKVIITALAQ